MKQELTAQFLANRHGLLAFIRGFIRNPQDAEDVFQEVWVRLSEALDRGVEIEDVGKWCRGVAKNLMLHYWRGQRDDKVVVDQELVDLVEQAFNEQEVNQALWEARRRALAECVQNLPDRSKRILSLKYDVGLKAEQVANQLQQSAASIMMILSRLRKLLKQCAERKLTLTDFGQ